MITEEQKALLKDVVGPLFEASGIPGVANIFTNGHRVIDIRGWGYFQYLKDKEGKIVGEETQDAFSQWVCDALNEKYERDFKSKKEESDDEKWPWVLWDSIDNTGLRLGSITEFTQDPDDMEGFSNSNSVWMRISCDFGHHPGDHYMPVRKNTVRKILSDVTESGGPVMEPPALLDLPPLKKKK